VGGRVVGLFEEVRLEATAIISPFGHERKNAMLKTLKIIKER
jgi:hypothetical protein